MTLETGIILHDRYQLQQKLGQSAGRQTWLANDLTTQPSEPVIVKLLATIEQWEALKLFEREAAVLQQLHHPHIPRYRDFFSIEDRLAWFGLVQDYIPGISLQAALDEGRHFSLAQVQQWTMDILEILINLHSRNPPILHRDIKPSNLILSDRQLYLVDFGAVQDQAGPAGCSFTVVGTYGYAPLEQYGGRAVPASDLYALGATLIHLLTGVAPAELPQQDLRIQFRGRVSLPLPFVSWIEKMTDPDLTTRFVSAKEARRVLEWQIRNLSIEAGGQPAPVPEKLLNRISEPIPLKAVLDGSNDRTKVAISPSKRLNDHLPESNSYRIFDTTYRWIVLDLDQPQTFKPSIRDVYCWVAITAAKLELYRSTSPFGQPRTWLMIDRDQFKIYADDSGEIIATGKTAEIHNVFLDQTNNQSAIILQTNDRQYSFGGALKPGEMRWVIREIRDWLTRVRLGQQVG